jgi:hypothetical protein
MLSKRRMAASKKTVGQTDKRETMKAKTVAAAIAASLTLVACDGPPPSAPAPASSADAPRIASSYLPPPEPPERPPSHNYATEEDGLYGYQAGISDDERNHGIATKALVMIRYRGKRNDVYVVEMPGDSAAMRMECKDPCEFVKTKVIVDGRVIKTETVPNVQGSLISAVFEDALGGQLKIYRSHG